MLASISGSRLRGLCVLTVGGWVGWGVVMETFTATDGNESKPLYDCLDLLSWGVKGGQCTHLNSQIANNNQLYTTQCLYLFQCLLPHGSLLNISGSSRDLGAGNKEDGNKYKLVWGDLSEGSVQSCYFLTTFFTSWHFKITKYMNSNWT